MNSESEPDETMEAEPYVDIEDEIIQYNIWGKVRWVIWLDQPILTYIYHGQSLNRCSRFYAWHIYISTNLC